MEAILGVVVVIQAAALWAISTGQHSTYRSMLHAIKAESAAEFAMLEKSTRRPARKAHKSEPAPTPYGL